jgi:hypothetical protein
MNDRELLELAAKAAGIPGLKYRGGPCIPAAWIYDYEDARTYKTWNPLTDDGDALRLAVKLRIDIQNLDTGVCAQRNYGSVRTYAVEPYTHDPAAATRRAIVRDAAEIGATQPSKDGGGDE